MSCNPSYKTPIMLTQIQLDNDKSSFPKFSSVKEPKVYTYSKNRNITSSG